MAYLQKKANLNEVINNILKQVGKKVRVVVSEINGFDGYKSIMYLTNIEGTLINFKLDENDVFESTIIVETGSSPLIAESDSPIYQCGVALILDSENKVIYENLDIINYEGNYRDKIEENFDLNSFDSEKVIVKGA